MDIDKDIIQTVSNYFLKEYEDIKNNKDTTIGYSETHPLELLKRIEELEIQVRDLTTCVELIRMY